MVMLRRLLPFVFITGAPFVVCAQNAPVPAASTSHLPEIIVDGTRIPIAVEESPNDVTVITRNQIDETQQRCVADVLRDVAGVNVARNGQPGGQTSVFVRGANSNQTLVLIDGVRVNNPFNNSFDFANLPV